MKTNQLLLKLWEIIDVDVLRRTKKKEKRFFFFFIILKWANVVGYSIGYVW